MLEYNLASYVFGGFFCEFIIQIECILLTLNTRIYELFNVYFSKKYEEAPFIVMLIAVIVFKTFQISKKKIMLYVHIFSNCLTHPAGTCDDFITRNSEAILKLKDKKMNLNDEEAKVDFKTGLNEYCIFVFQDCDNLTEHLQDLTSISASGFFTVDRALVTAIMANTVSYVILLAQERMSN